MFVRREGEVGGNERDIEGVTSAVVGSINNSSWQSSPQGDRECPFRRCFLWTLRNERRWTPLRAWRLRGSLVQVITCSSFPSDESERETSISIWEGASHGVASLRSGRQERLTQTEGTTRWAQNTFCTELPLVSIISPLLSILCLLCLSRSLSLHHDLTRGLYGSKLSAVAGK